MKNKLLFSLDIGTRSVIGIVAEQVGNTLKILATERKEHNTRAMLDGQIHDVPEVAAILADVKNTLEQTTGPLKNAAVAAAGRALYTVTADATVEVSEVMALDDERALDFAAIQAAQKNLASSNTVDDPTMYYCVGYSTVKYSLDGTQLKTLVGQRGKSASATVIATFLPRQVIDSMQSALHEAQLEMSALTLEPIAAINVLIPPTMRHLNLILVDIGAGTSDVAVTKNGSVVGYGMVPLAGDEITEAISQKYLLDFNIAEGIKRQLAAGSKQRKLTFCDILGIEYKLTPKEIIEAIMPNVAELAQSIAAQILQLNTTAPQAVLLVGGGSLTPCLPEVLAQALDIPAPRVAVRTPEAVSGIESIPDELKTPDSVTPLGILKIASTQTLNFITITVNNKELRLFNFSSLTVSDALLAAGINLKTLGGKPGLGITVKINNLTKFFSGTMGKIAKLTVNNEPATLTTPVKNNDIIVVTPGIDGKTPLIRVSDIAETPPSFDVFINEERFSVESTVLVNNAPAASDLKLSDRDVISWHQVKHLGEILVKANYTPTPRKYKFQLNGSNSQYSVSPKILLNGQESTISTVINPDDSITFIEPKPLKLRNVINLSESDTQMTIYFNKARCQIPTARCQVTLDGQTADLDAIVKDNSEINYTISEKSAVNVSDVLLAAEFKPPSAQSLVKFEILVNHVPAEFTSPVKNGDSIDVLITPI